MVREFTLTFNQVKEKLAKTNCLASISFSLTIGLVVRMVIALFVVSKYELITQHCEIASICVLPIY